MRCSAEPGRAGRDRRAAGEPPAGTPIAAVLVVGPRVRRRASSRSCSPPASASATAEPGAAADGGRLRRRSAARARLPRSPPAPPRCSPRRGRMRAPQTLRALLVGGARPARSAARSPRRARASSTSAARPPRGARRRPADPHLRPRRRRRLAGATRSIRLRNVSTPPADRLRRHRPAARRRAFRSRCSARRIEIEPGAAAKLAVQTPGRSDRPGARPRPGTLTLTPVGGAPIRVPWAVVLRPPARLARPARRSRARAFKPSEQQPAVVVVRAGRVVPLGRRNRSCPCSGSTSSSGRDKGKRLGLLARLRDLLPGRYAFGLTGRGPGRQRARAGPLPAARLRLADRRRPADRAVDRLHDPVITELMRPYDSARHRASHQGA